jgi:hypothetical protein
MFEAAVDCPSWTGRVAATAAGVVVQTRGKRDLNHHAHLRLRRSIDYNCLSPTVFSLIF